MEDTTRLKIILLGLFLAALALGYLIFSQRTTTREFQARPVTQMETTPGVPAGGDPSTLGKAVVSPTTPPAAQMPATQATVTPTPQTIAQANETTKGGQTVSTNQTLPNTGVPSVLAGIFSALSALAGWKLRRFSFRI